MITAGPDIAWWISAIAATSFEILLPLALIFFAHARLKVSWRYAAFGALIFFTFQLITRVPLIQVAQYFLQGALKSSKPLLIAFLLIAALTAGIFEEVGRYLGYRWFMGREEKTWAKGVMYGLGHGGLESVVLVAGLSILQLVNVWLLTSTNLGIIPVSQRATAAKQLAALVAQPSWLPLLGGWERICAIAAHVAFSLIVL
ncbi:MAG TPA: YhfC family glutamic-type intramembrane protease, partial [Ktedonobacterales bacterium]